MELKLTRPETFCLNSVKMNSSQNNTRKWEAYYLYNMADAWNIDDSFLLLLLSAIPESAIEKILKVFPEINLRKGYKKSMIECLSGKVLRSKQFSNRENDLYSIIKEGYFKVFEESDEIEPGIQTRFCELEDIFELNQEEAELIRFLFAMSQNFYFEDVFNGSYLTRDERERQLEIAFERFSAATKIPEFSLKKIAGSPDNKLFLLGFFEIQRKTKQLPIKISDEIYFFLRGASTNSFTNKYFIKSSISPLDASSHRVTKNNLEIAKELLNSKGKANLLLHGEPGTGKTEFAKAICAEIQKEAYFVSFDYFESDFDVSDRTQAITRNLYVTMRVATQNKGIVVFDEADSFLNRGNFGLIHQTDGDKGWVNRLFDESEAKIIWITNHISQLDQSTMRRFQYSIHFQDFSRHEQTNAWRTVLEKSFLKNHISDGFIEKLSNDFSVNPGGIKNAVDTAELTLRDLPPDKNSVENRIIEILSSHVELMSGSKPILKKNESEAYDANSLNTDKDIRLILNSLEKYFEEVQISNMRKPHANLNLLFWGLPGTGKTEFAKYLARSIKRDLILKRASDLKSMWAGQTEKLIRSAFMEAERAEGILLIDEADSFLQCRDGEFRSWEIPQVNEFLTSMENFSGVLVCTTNFMKNLDPASLRRFSWKVEFKPLRSSDKVRLFEKYFWTLCEVPTCEPNFPQSINIENARMSDPEFLDTQQKNRIEEIPNLTPGDFQ